MVKERALLLAVLVDGQDDEEGDEADDEGQNDGDMRPVVADAAPDQGQDRAEDPDDPEKRADLVKVEQAGHERAIAMVDRGRRAVEDEEERRDDQVDAHAVPGEVAPARVDAADRARAVGRPAGSAQQGRCEGQRCDE